MNKKDKEIEKEALDDSDVGKQLDESKKTIIDLIKKIGKPGVASESHYQKKLQKLDDGLARLKLLEASIQEVKVDKDPYKGLFSDFKWISGDMRKELKDKQLVSDTKDMYDKLLKDKEFSKIYKSQLVMDEKTINKKLDELLKSRDNLTVYTREFHEVIPKLNTPGNQQMFINILTDRISKIMDDRDAQNVLCNLIAQVRDDVRVFDESFHKQLDGLIGGKEKGSTGGICHGNITSFSSKQYSKGKGSKKGKKGDGKKSKSK